MAATAHFPGAVVRCGAATENGGEAPGPLAVSTSFRLREEHLVAALFDLLCGMEQDELDDDAIVREMVAEHVVNGGLDGINEAWARMRDVVPGSTEAGWLEECRTRVRQAFALAGADRRATPLGAVGADLVGV